jgi:uncharacterized tellurite resistance protein B-like protein
MLPSGLRMTRDPRVEMELIKLLMQVAWADHEVGEEEAKRVFDHARRLNLSQKAQDTMWECLRGTRKLPAPDLGFLRQHAAIAYELAEGLVHADGEVTEDEVDTLAQVKSLLGA